jgi:hypothetical protein
MYYRLFSVVLLSLGTQALQLSGRSFQVSIDDASGAVTSIANANDATGMSWVSASENAPWIPLSSRWGLGFANVGTSLNRAYWTNAKVQLQNDGASVSYTAGNLSVVVQRNLNDLHDSFTERYVFKNIGSTSLNLASSTTQFAIYTPFNDHYTNTTDSEERRSHAHVWASGGSSSWVKMTRMNGTGPHLGLVLTEGSLAGYSIEGRDTVTSSNTRGVFLLHPSTFTLQPGESKSVAWSMFWHNDWDDFFDNCLQQSDQFINFNISSLSAVVGENINIIMEGAVNESSTVAGTVVTPLGNGSGYGAIWAGSKVGEQTLQVIGARGNSTITVNVVPSLDHLSTLRTQFIATNQQVPESNVNKSGAYAVYDTQMKGIVTFDTATDRNTGRERVGMGVLMSRQLAVNPNQTLQDSLVRYYRFVCTKLQNSTGYVGNDVGDSKLRLYNFPWVMTLHVTMSKLNIMLPEDIASPTPLERFMITMESFYSLGGADMYPIGLPIIEGLTALQNGGHTEAYQRALSLYTAHAETIFNAGTYYPAQEVNYEQSIVAPAAIFLLEMYRWTKNERWLAAAKPHFDLLLLFGGRQPDYHMHDIAIRHWDGYWFGKDRMWGDIFPHYWSTLTGVAMYHYGKATGELSYQTRAEGIMKANMALFGTDGSASCAWIYPVSVNGRAGHYKDGYANDQDWALAHYLMIRDSV